MMSQFAEVSTEDLNAEVARRLLAAEKMKAEILRLEKVILGFQKETGVLHHTISDAREETTALHQKLCQGRRETTSLHRSVGNLHQQLADLSINSRKDHCCPHCGEVTPSAEENCY